MSSMPLTPEQKARATIDEYLRHAGWDVQDRSEYGVERVLFAFAYSLH